MEQLLRGVYMGVAALFLGELAIGLLPEGGMKRFCKFILGILLVFIILGVWKPEKMPDLEFSVPQPAGSYAPDAASYEEIILDVYHREMENKNN